MALALCVLFFLGLVLLITLFGYRRYVRFERLKARLGAVPDTAGALSEPESVHSAAKQRAPWLLLIMRFLPGASVSGLLPETGNKSLVAQKELAQAGFRPERALTVLTGLRMFCAVS